MRHRMTQVHQVSQLYYAPRNAAQQILLCWRINLMRLRESLQILTRSLIASMESMPHYSLSTHRYNKDTLYWSPHLKMRQQSIRHRNEKFIMLFLVKLRTDILLLLHQYKAENHQLRSYQRRRRIHNALLLYHNNEVDGL